ncbi:MAG: LuxR C-terminal-related transcriptional regulator [Fibrobacteria bacterium]
MGIAFHPVMLAKFSAPEAPRFLFPRPWLLARLARWSEFPLTQIAAPAGYGKTTLAAECFRGWKGCKCWIALDEGDSEPGRFLLTLAHGLCQANPDLAKAIGISTLSVAIPDPDTLLSRILEGLDTLSCQMVTILDDCGLLATPQVRRMATRFLSAAPARAHFVLITRDPTLLPITRWRLRQEVLELGAPDLALNENQFETWLSERLSLRPAKETLKRLHGLFEGWLAGLQLLALKLDREPDPCAALEAVDPGHPFLFEYLLEEVLRDLPLEWRRFLLETSILRHLQPGLCDEVRQAGNSAHLLHALHQSQCFLVPLSGGGGYRYHRLFAESLQGLLERWDPAEVPSLHRRAARWHLRHGGLEVSLEHALTAEDGDTLEALAARALENLFRNSEFAALQRHVLRIPESLCTGRPWLSIFCAWACFHIGKEQDGAARLKEAERILLPEGRPDRAGSAIARVQWAHLFLLKGILSRLDGVFSKGLDWIRRAEELVPPEALFLRASLGSQAGVMRFLAGDLAGAESGLRRTLEMAEKADHHLAYFGAAYTMCEMLGLQGRLEDAAQLLETCDRRSATLPDAGGPAAGYARIARARWLRLLGRPVEAMAEAEAGIAAGLAGGNIRILNYGYATEALLLAEGGDGDAACERLEKAESFALRNRMHWAVDADDLRALRIRCLGPDRERPSADAWMARERSALGRPSWMGVDRCRTACAWMEWNGDASGAARLAAQWADHAGRAGWEWVAREFRARAARLSGLRGIHSAHRLPAAAVESISGPLGMPAVSLSDGTASPSPVSAPPTAACELSEREIEVLRAMREGKSNKQIAGSLFVAPSTVKTHLKSIFTKLEVNNRLLAVTRAVESGLLP